MPSAEPGAGGGATRRAPARNVRMSVPLFSARTVGALALAVILPGLAARAEVIILKDGYTLHGVRIFEGKDRTLRQGVRPRLSPSTRPNGVTAIDDNARYVVFPNDRQAGRRRRRTNRFKDLTAYPRERPKGDMATRPLPSTTPERGRSRSGDPTWTRVVGSPRTQGSTTRQAADRGHQPALHPRRLVHAPDRPVLPDQGVPVGHDPFEAR